MYICRIMFNYFQCRNFKQVCTIHIQQFYTFYSIKMLKNPKLQKFWKLAAQRNIKLKNDRKQSEVLFKKIQEHASQSSVNSCIEQACADPRQIEQLKQLIAEIERNPQLIAVIDRAEANREILESLQRRWNQTDQILSQKNAKKENMFKRFYRQSALLQESSRLLNVMFVLATPFTLKNVYLAYKKENVGYREPLPLTSQLINKTQYCYSLYKRQLHEGSRLIIQYDQNGEQNSLEIQNIHIYLKHFYKAGIIALDFSHGDFEMVRTTSILYCIDGLYHIFHAQERAIQKTYQWLGLLYQQCFKVSSSDFKVATNFESKLPSQIAISMRKDNKNTLLSEKYLTSRPYAYILMALLEKKQQIMALYLSQENILIKSLAFPLLKEHAYIDNKHLPQFQKIYLQLCWRFSLKIDKQSLQHRTKMSKVAIFSQEDSQSMEIIKILLEQCPDILASFSEEDILKAITRNKYISVGTIIFIFIKLLKKMRQMKKNITFQSFLLKLFQSILIKLQKAEQIYEDDKKKIWSEEITETLCLEILYFSNTSIFMVKSNWIEFYIILKKISFYNGQLYKVIMRLVQQSIIKQFQKYETSIKSIQAFSRLPQHQFDEALLKNGLSTRNLEVSQYQKFIAYRYQNDQAFNCRLFDQYLYIFLQQSLKEIKSLKKIGETIKLFDKLILRFDDFKEISQTALKLLEIIDFSAHQFRIRDEISGFLKQLISLKTRLKDLCYDIVKDKLIAAKIQRLGQIIAELTNQMEDTDRQYLEYIQRSLKSGNKKDKESQKQQFWSALIDIRCATKLKAFKLNKANLEWLVQSAKPKIQSNDMHENELVHLYPNKKDIESSLGELATQICNEIQKANKMHATFKQKLKDSRELLQAHQDFKVEISKILYIEERTNQFKLNRLYKLEQTSEQIKLFIQIASDFKRLVLPSVFWQKSPKVQHITYFLQRYDEIRAEMRNQLSQFYQNQQYSYAKYVQLIRNQPIEQWCRLLFQNRLPELQTNIQLLRLQKLKSIHEIIESIQAIERERDKSQEIRPSFAKFKLSFQKILKKQLISVKVLVNQVNSVLDQFQVQFKSNNKKQILSDYKVKIICLVRKHNEMLKEIKKMNITPEIILNLKQYINGHIYSNIKNEEVTYFEEVVLFVKNTSNKKFSELVMYLKKEQDRPDKLKSLAQSIEDCADMFQTIKEKLKQAEDRQISFKDQIQQIFKDDAASWNIQLDLSSSPKLNYYLSLSKQMSNRKMPGQKEFSLPSKNLNLKQLQALAQNCLIFKTQTQKNLGNKTFATSLNKFLEFYKIITTIRDRCEKLLEYGYNPKQLISNLRLTNNSSLQNYSQEVTRALQCWKQDIMLSYKQAYFLTFFKGYAIQQLIMQIQTRTMLKRLAFQFQISKEEYLSIYDSPKLKQCSQFLQNPKKKIFFVKQFLICLQEMYKQKQKLEMKDKSVLKNQANKVFLIVAKQNHQIYHLCKENQLSLHQIFFCLQETTILQLETFVLRSLRGRNKKYFVIGAQWLSLQVKTQFLNVVKRQYKKGNDSQNDRKLFFIDTNSSDTLYCYLNWSIEIDFKIINDDIISQKEVENNLNNNYLKNVKLVTSVKSGLGKTFSVERKAASEGKTVVFFPICGNISLKNLFQRLKAKQINKNCFLLIQLGFFSPEQQKNKHNVMINMRKLQIFLTEVIIFRKFYLQGDYINIPQQVSIFIQIQNLLQSAFYIENNKEKAQAQKSQQKYQIHLLNLLDRFNAKHHIEKFDLECIQRKSSDLKDIFVYKYLQLLDSKTINSTNLLFRDLQPKITRQNYETLKAWLYSQEFNVFYSSISKNSQFSRENSLQQRIKQKVSIDMQILVKFVKVLVKFPPQQWQLYQTNIKDNPDYKRNHTEKQFEASLSKLEEEIQNYQLPSYPPNCLHLINKYFKSRHEKDITYRTYRYFMNILYQKINTFSQSSYLMPESFQYAKKIYYLKDLDIPKIRQNFLSRLISNTSKILQETTFTSIQKSSSEFYPNLQSESTIILSAKDCSCYQFVYKEEKKEDLPIKTLIATQNSQYVSKVAKRYLNSNSSKIKEEINQIFQKESFNNMKEQDQEKKIMEILYSISENKNFLGSWEEIQKKVQAFNEYRLTKDNFFKICYIIQKAASNLPIIIMGQSGVGKTALIKFLVKEIFNEVLEICNVHAGVHLQQLTAVIEKVKKTANENKNKRVWVFFDEYNTTDQLSYIKEIVIDRKFLGEDLPQNLIFCTACNPYRMKLNTKKRAFNVKPPNLSMVAFMWDYQQLKQQQCKEYCLKMLKQINLKQKTTIIDTIVKLHQTIHSEHQKSYASLRDVARFKQLYLWFLKSLPKQALSMIEDSYSKQNYKLIPELRSLYLAYYFVYILKISHSRSKQAMTEIIQQNFSLRKGFIQNLVKNEQIDFTVRLKQPDSKIAYNKALRQNLFTAFVCILNKIPVLLIGQPGSSKSLSIKLINSNLRGKHSSNQFCGQFPEFLFHYFQGSQSSTSEGILKVFDVTNKKKPINTQYCILFDEIGLAGKSIHNPLKVMHSKIETHNKDIAIIAISNEALDAAKMSRFLAVSRQEMHLNQLIETAQQIYKAYIPKDLSKLQIVKKTAQNYYNFIQDEKAQCSEYYYGLRDFYCLIKYICSKFVADMNQNQDEVLRQAIRINFDLRREAGQKQSKDYLRFLEIANLKRQQSYKSVDQIINSNINEPESRYLLFSVQQNSIVYLLSCKIFTINQARKKVRIMYGSPFNADNSSQEYNIYFTSKIISHASNGGIIAIKDLNNSIQTSLYDLFNKSFTTVGKKMYCRVAVGDKSNPRCQIHPQFLAILFVMKDQLSKLDPPFLNRFEKHSLNILDELNTEQTQLLEFLENWIQSVQKLWSRCKVKNRQNYLLNTSKQCLASLICSTQDIKYPGRIEYLLKKKIIQNSTSQFDALVRKVAHKGKNQDLAKEVLQIKDDIAKQIGKSQPRYDPFKSERDSIIYTFNNFEEVMKENQPNESVRYLKFSHNEKQLKQNLTQELLSDQIKMVQINCEFQKDKNYLDYLLHLIKSIKEEHINKPLRRVRIVIELSRYMMLKYSTQKQSKKSSFKINISYLHPFQQYFYGISMQKIIQFDTYQQLFINIFTDKFHSKCILQAIKYFNIVSEDQHKIIYYYDYLCKTSDRLQFKNTCNQFITKLLRQDKLAYETIMLESTQQQKEERIKDNASNNFKQLLVRRLQLKIIPFYRAIIHSLVKSKVIYLFDSTTESELHYSDEASKLQFDWVSLQDQIKQTISELLSKKVQEVAFKQVERNLVFDQDRFYHPYSYSLVNLIFYDYQTSDTHNVQFNTRNFFIQNQQPQQIPKQQKKKPQSFIKTPSRLQQLIQIIQQSNDKLKLKNESQKFMILTDVVTKLLSLLKLNKKLAMPVAYLLKTIQKGLKVDENQSNLVNEIIIITFNRQYWKILIEMIQNLCSYYNVKDLHATLLNYPIEYQFKARQKKLKDCFGLFIQSILKLVAESIQIAKYDVFSNHYIKVALQLLKKVNELIDLNKSFVKKHNLKYQLEFPSKNYAELKLVELFVNLSISNQEQLLQNYIKKTNGRFNYVAVAQFCQQLLKLVGQNKKQASKIITYLAYGLFSHFCDQFEHHDKKIKSEMMQKAKKIADSYPQFANLLSLQFFPKLLDKSFESCEYNFSRFLADIEKRDQFQLAPNQIGNFSISLGLTLRVYIWDMLYFNQEQFIDYAYAHQNLKNYQFYQKLLSLQRPKRIAELFKNQFLKAYLQNYIDIIFFSQIADEDQRTILTNINKHLSSNKATIVHLKIYLFKYIYSKFKPTKTFEEVVRIIRQKSKEKICSWLQFCDEFLSKNKDANYYLPVNIFDDRQPFLKQFKSVENGKFQNEQVKKLMIQGLSSPQNTYHLLTIFATLFYTEQIKDTARKEVTNVINSMGQYNRPQNQIVKTLLLLYIRGRVIAKEVQYKKDEMERYKRILPLLNFLNLLISYRLLQNCYIQMFFSKGVPIKNLQQQLKHKFIFGVLNNPEIVRCFELLSTNQPIVQNKKYKKCLSKDCEYVFELESSYNFSIFGNQSELNANAPRTYKSKSNIFVSSFGAEVCPICSIQLPEDLIDMEDLDLNQHLQKLKDKKMFKNVQEADKEAYQLRGFQLKTNKEDIFAYNKVRNQIERSSDHLKSQNNYSLLTTNILQLMMYFAWWVFSSLKEDSSISKIYGSSAKLKQIWQAYYAEIQKQPIISRNQTSICLYSICNFMRKQLNTSYQQKQRSTLFDQTAKIQFCKQLQKNLALALGQNQQKFMKENICPRYSTTEDIIKQEGLAQLHRNEYKQIELFRMYENININNLKDFNKLHLNSLQYTHPALYSMLYNIEKVQQIYKHLKKIYVFVYRIWLVYNFQLKKQYQNHPIKQILNSKILTKDPNFKNKMDTSLVEFYESWNYFAKTLQFKLDHPAYRPYENEDFLLSHFIIDNRAKSQRQSLMLSFISKTSKDYNLFCHSMQSKIQQHCFNNNKEKKVLNRVGVNPTFLSSERQFWSVTSDIINSHIKKTRHYSVVYGNSKCQFQFEQLQNSLIKELYSTHYLTNPSSFKRFYFIDSDPIQDAKQLSSFTQKLNDVEQKKLNKLYQQNINKADQLLESLRYSLEKIIYYLKYLKPNPDQFIGEFLKKQQERYKDSVNKSKLVTDTEQTVTHPFREIDEQITKDPIASLPLAKIVSLYNFFRALQTRKSETSPQRQVSTERQASKTKTALTRGRGNRNG